MYEQDQFWGLPHSQLCVNRLFYREVQGGDESLCCLMSCLIFLPKKSWKGNCLRLFLSFLHDFPLSEQCYLAKFNCQAGLALLHATCVGCLSGLAPGATKQRKSWIVFFLLHGRRRRKSQSCWETPTQFMALLLLSFNFVQCWWSTCCSKFLPPGLQAVWWCVLGNTSLQRAKQSLNGNQHHWARLLACGNTLLC